MKLLFDLTKTQPIGGTKYHGGGKYGIQVFKKLVEIAPEKIAVFYNDELFLDEEVLSLLVQYHIKTYLSKNITILAAAKEEGGILYSPLPSKAYLNAEDITVLTTIHGRRDLVVPTDKNEYCYLKKVHWKDFMFFKLFPMKLQRYIRFRKALKRKEYICENFKYVTVSEHSKYTLLSLFPTLKAENIKVYYSPSTINQKLNIESYQNIYGKYWLMVGGNRWIKNSIRAIQAFDILFSERPELEGNVVITGVKSLNFNGLKIQHKDRFKCVGYVDEVTLKGLYHYAWALVYPSLYEGFGYPPLEAMYEGCPVITSSASSIPEVCGNAVLYFNPYLLVEIKARILQIENIDTRKYYVAKSKIQQSEVFHKQERDLLDLCNYLMSYVK